MNVIHVPPGIYTIGDDTVVNAKPRHDRRIDTAFYIEARPASVSSFEDFVRANGYSESAWWFVADCMCPTSVDQRCAEIFDASTFADTGSNRPVRGLTWYEAHAAARAEGARLPFETEWEIAAGRAGGTFELPAELLEWTADAYAPLYWRADFSRRGNAWTRGRAEKQVAVRGKVGSSLIRRHTARQGRSPEEADRYCGFRRVWDALPQRAVIL